MRILSIDAEKRNRKICDHVIHNDTITSDFVSGAEELRKLIMPESENDEKYRNSVVWKQDLDR